MGFLGLTFLAPAVLIALPLLYALYRLLRVTPPQPQETLFPPLRLLLGLNTDNPTPNRTPWPLLLLRLLAAATVILAAAGPQWSQRPLGASHGGALALIVDDGWAAAPDWSDRVAFLDAKLDEADKAGRPVALAFASQAALGLVKTTAAQAKTKLHAAAPQPFAPDLQDLAASVTRLLTDDSGAEAVWLADGLSQGGADALASALAPFGQGGRASVVTGAATPLALNGVENAAEGLKVNVARADANAPANGVVRALDAEGREVARRPFDFAGAKAAQANFDIPIELRNDVAQLALEGQRSAGAVWLVDDRWRRKRVALAEGASVDTDQPLVSPLYFLRRALAPSADLTEAPKNDPEPILTLLSREPSVLILADMNIAPGKVHDAIADFVAKGGVLVRFAGSRLAAGDDDLTPVRLRRGGRTLGGALSWEAPKHIAAFEPQSPFANLKAPDEVTVTRQVLAEPDEDLDPKVWARLADGTPLVTASRQAKGLLVLFHVTADTSWSNLPISGLFVGMLNRVVSLGLNAGVGAAPSAANAGAAARGGPR